MARVKNGKVTRQRRKKVLKAAKGYFGSKHRLYKTAQEQVFHSGAYAYRDRKQNKRNFRKLWITRINAACRENEISYSQFINGLNKAKITINRKMLAEMALNDSKAFANLVKIVKDTLNGKEILEVKAVKKDNLKKEETATKKQVNKEDYSKKTLIELKKIAQEKGVKGYSTMKKADLINALK